MNESHGKPNIMDNNYDDIINLPHHEPTTKPRMSMYARAAQFAPFAALNGHAEAIQKEMDQNMREDFED